MHIAKVLRSIRSSCHSKDPEKHQERDPANPLMLDLRKNSSFSRTSLSKNSKHDRNPSLARRTLNELSTSSSLSGSGKLIIMPRITSLHIFSCSMWRDIALAGYLE